jgi:hypothetical protein
MAAMRGVSRVLGILRAVAQRMIDQHDAPCIASPIGVARMPTHGSWRPCVLTVTARPALSIE